MKGLHGLVQWVVTVPLFVLGCWGIERLCVRVFGHRECQRDEGP